jgi:molybdopterin-guanine dinucleotide biosynthesis protein A
VAALEACESEWLVVLACDLPRADARVLERLCAKAEALALDACLLESAGGVEPLFAVYRAGTCRAPARAALEGGERRLVSFHAGLRVGTLREAALEHELAALDSARNLNTPEDLERERRARESGGEPRPEERA